MVGSHAQLARLGDRNGLVVRVHHEQRVGQPLHALDAGKVGRKMLALPLQLDDFLLGQQVIAPVGGHVVEFLKALHRLLHRYPVGEQPAQPAAVDIGHATAVGLFGNRVLRLALGPDKQHQLALGGQLGHELRRLFEHLQRLLQVDDVNAVAFPEDILLHLRIPALRLVSEVDASLEQFLHGDISHSFSLVKAARYAHWCLD